MQETSIHKRGRIFDSPNFRDGSFRNLSPTPMKPDDVSYFKMIRDGFNRPQDVKPSSALPSIKTDLKNLQADAPVIIWFGHSSYLIHCRGVNILVDPVFSGHASPFSFMVKVFEGANIYQSEDMPVIDALILTHNHYDHLDRHTLSSLKHKINAWYMPLGVASFLSCDNDKPVKEMDWGDTEDITQDIRLTATPARHFSGRGLKRNGSLWASFVLEIFGYRIFIGGDSGYDSHFKTTGEQYGPFDIAMLECGQYNTSWPFIHMMPEEMVQAGMDLNAKALLPVHWGKFALASHPWSEPAERAWKNAEKHKVKIAFPMIGQPVVINETYPAEPWWRKLSGNASPAF